MARIRTIKPDFPQSESMGAVSRDSRLLFIMLWTASDDSGRLRGNSRMLASTLFPYDDDAKDLIDGWLAELESERCIIRYVVDGASYVQICNWLNHQKIDKPSPSKLPPIPDDSTNPREDSRSLPVGKEGKGIGEEGKGTAAGNSVPDNLVTLAGAQANPQPAAAATPGQPISLDTDPTGFCRQVLAAYAETWGSSPPLTTQTMLRIQTLAAADPAARKASWWRTYFEIALEDPFLSGSTRRDGKRADLLYLLREDTFTRLIDHSRGVEGRQA